MGFDMPGVKDMFKVGLECLRSAALSARDTYARHSAEQVAPAAEKPPHIQGLIDYLREEGLLTEEELLEGSDLAEVETQLGDILRGAPAIVGDSYRMIANEILLSSKCFVLIAVDDAGGIKYQIDLLNGSSADVAACQVACSQIAEDLYDQIANDRYPEVDGGEEEGE